MAPQYSTSVSDAVLAVTALTASYTVFIVSAAGSVGFATLAVAASLGAVRFFRDIPSDGHIKCHKYMSLLVQTLGLPLIATAFLKQFHPIVSNVILALALAIFFVERATSFKDVARLAGAVIGPVSMLAILVCSVSQFNGCGIVGVLLFALAAVVVKTEGEMFSLKRVDLFHYVLVVATVALMKGLEVSNSLPDIYYRSDEHGNV